MCFNIILTLGMYSCYRHIRYLSNISIPWYVFICSLLNFSSLKININNPWVKHNSNHSQVPHILCFIVLKVISALTTLAFYVFMLHFLDGILYR